MNEEDRKETDTFYIAEQGKLFGFIRRMGLSIHDSEEISNEAFLAICVHWSEIRDGSPRGYLYTAARNEIYRRWRTVGRRPEDFWDPSAATTGEFADQVAEQETLRLALDKLTTREREAVLLRYYAEFNVAETSQIMGGLTPGAVKRYAFEGRAKLRYALTGRADSDTREEGTR